MNDFFQTGPTLENQYSDDALLRSWLRRLLPADMLAAIEPGLAHLGALAAGPMPELADAAERNPPVHVPFDPWGRRVDEIRVDPAWEELHTIAAEEGIVAVAFEREHGALSRIHQMARLYLYHPSSAIYSCPLAMTDGAARVLELMGTDDLKERVLPRLLSRDPLEFWTSGQWMTERTGGSDVGKSLTVAEHDGTTWRLTGTKWFTSAVTADIALTLARTDPDVRGGKGLSLFYVELQDEQGRLDNIEVHRLKDKLGTKALPTAELSLRGTPAILLGGEGHGIRKIAPLLNITRAYNSVCAVGYMRRALVLAKDYAHRRVAFGRPLAEQPLHLETLADLQVELEGGFALAMRVAELLGREECDQASEDESALLRVLTPLTKLYTGKQSPALCSEVLECFGGAGYVEDTGLPRLLRDAQVTPIWEGTTNILSLDVLRAMEREHALGPLLNDTERLLDGVDKHEVLSNSTGRVRQSVRELSHYAQALNDLSPDAVQAGARAFALGLAATYAGALLLHHAAWSIGQNEDATKARVGAARRWCERLPARLIVTDDERTDETRSLALA